MKKVITILMLAMAVILGGATMDAKSTSKKSSSKSSSSSSWNGDIPSASFIMKMGSWSSSTDSQFKKHGYQKTASEKNDDYREVTWTKPGVCKVNYFDSSVDAADTSWNIEVYDSSKCTKLYNDLKRVFKSQKYWNVEREGNKISVNYFN